MTDHTPKHLNLRIVGNDLRPGTLRYALLPDAEKHRLMQAEELLREAGFVEHDDGTWHPADEFGEKS